jgi:hypothetical protein
LEKQEMKIGDLIKVKSCDSFPESHPLYSICECFFCSGRSNRVGLITGHAPRNSWRVMFDCGDWRIDDFEEAQGEVEVIGVAK